MIRVLRFLVLAIVWFVGLSFALVIVFRFVPIPVTATMLMDEHGIAKDWEPLDNIDRNMVRAVIAGEDGKFCEHDGFDRDAIEKAIERNARGGRIRGGSTISQQTAKNVFLWQGGGYLRNGIEAGAQRYFEHSAARLSPTEAARMAAALPLPKARAVVSPSGFTRRYGNMIQARIGVVRRDGLDSCIYD